MSRAAPTTRTLLSDGRRYLLARKAPHGRIHVVPGGGASDPALNAPTLCGEVPLGDWRWLVGAEVSCSRCERRAARIALRKMRALADSEDRAGALRVELAAARQDRVAAQRRLHEAERRLGEVADRAAGLVDAADPLVSAVGRWVLDGGVPPVLRVRTHPDWLRVLVEADAAGRFGRAPAP